MERWVGFILLLVTLAGCSNASDDGGDGWQARAEKQDGKKPTLFETLQNKFSLGTETLKSAQELIEKQPGALAILQGQGSKEDWQSLDKADLKEQLQSFQEKAEASGLSLNQPLSASDRSLLGALATKLGISEERVAELESMARSQAEKKGLTAHSNPTATRPSSSTKPTRAEPAQLVNQSDMSEELRYILKRRQERMKEPVDASR
ncbi:MAG: hypothetical protein HQL72_11240 [Magnetococcales bacterium]|nr:hypothetical protein [Magnetococcales bacterium]